MEGGPNIQEVENPIIDSEEETEIVESGCAFMCCHPRGKFHRFIALIFICFLGFGSYFCYDNPAALEDYIKDDLNITTTQYVFLYSIYSWPNVFLCLIGGFLVDRVFGVRLGTNIYSSITLVGQILFATGVICNMYWLMVIGRFIFGIGAESLAVACNNYVVLWFKGKELNMVFGLQLSFARIGSTVNFLIIEPIYKWVHGSYTGAQCLGIVLFIATGTCLFSFLCALILGVMDKRAERLLRRDVNSGEVVRLSDIKDFKSTFWIISVICVTYYISIFPFIGLGKGFFETVFHMNKEDANALNSIVYLISGICSPLLGFLIDKSGKQISWILVAVMATITAHCLLAFSPLNPYVGMVVMGLAYSCLASSLWPLVSLIIPEHQLGTAYGVLQAVQNLGLAIFTVVAGVIEQKDGYKWMEVFFICSLILAFLASFILWLVDARGTGHLNMTPANRHQHNLSVTAAEIYEREKLLDSQDGPSITESQEGAQPSDFQIRNRYLSRIGAPLPEHIEGSPPSS